MFSVSALRASADSPPCLLQSISSEVLFEDFNLFRVRLGIWDFSSAGRAFLDVRPGGPSCHSVRSSPIIIYLHIYCACVALYGLTVCEH